MATNTDLSDVFFSQSVSSLNNKKIGVGADAFSSQYASQMYDPELTKPTGYEVPEITEKKQDIDVPGGSDPLSTDLSDAVMLFTDEEKEAERKRLGTSVTGVDAQLNALGPFDPNIAKVTSEFDSSKGISIGSVPPLASYKSGSTTDAGTIDEDIPDSGEMREQGIGIQDIRDTYNSGESTYNQMFGTEPAYTGQNTITTSPSSAYGAYAGAGVDLANYSKAFATGLGTTAAQSSIGLSSAPPASLAGSAASLSGATTAGTGYLANMGSTGYGTTVGAGAPATAGANWGGALKVGSQVLQIYGIQQAFASGTDEGKLSGTLQTAALLNPAYAPYVALYEGIKMLTGWGGIFGKGKDKPPMGGVEFRLTSQKYIDKYNGNPPADGSDQAAWLNVGNPEFDEAVENDTLRLTAPYSWGYNNYDHSIVKGQAQKQIDYLYAFADRYNVDINEETFIKAATGSGGFAKYKPTGDRGNLNHSILERIDSVGNGSSTANQWLREVFEYTGPNGEKIVSGTPSSNNIDVNTGLKTGFASQEDFENDITKFSQEFYS